MDKSATFYYYYCTFTIAKSHDSKTARVNIVHGNRFKILSFSTEHANVSAKVYRGVRKKKQRQFLNFAGLESPIVNLRFIIM